MAKDKPLTPMQERFAAEYPKDLNGKAAAIRAGFSPKTAESQASRLLRNVKVRELIDKRNQKHLDNAGITAERVLNELALLGFANMHDYIQITDGGEAYVDLSKLTREQAAAIQEIKVDESAGGAGDGERERVKRTTFKLASKRDALELLGKHLKLFTEKIEFNSDDVILAKLAAGRKRLQSAE